MSATRGSRISATVVPIIVALAFVAELSLTGCSDAVHGHPSAAAPGAVVDPGAVAPGATAGPRADVDTTPPSRPTESPSESRGAAPVDAAIVTGGTGTPSDQLAANVVTGVEQFWRERFPAEFGRRWINIHAFHAVDPGEPDVPAPCLRRPLDLTDQALYCPRRDIVAWDRDGLVPRLRNTYGDGAVLVALAHEIGHAVQDRLGISAEVQLREPTRYPTILLEGMADCFAGVAVHAAADGKVAKVTLSRADLDRALQALLTFRDPVGVAIGSTAHGDAFDRVSAFLDGYQSGAGTCAAMTVHNQTFTQRGYNSLSDVMQGGDLPLADLLSSMSPDAYGWFGKLAASRGRPWRTPLVSVLAQGRCPTPDVDHQGPVRYCPSSGAVSVSASELRLVQDGFGDYASAELVASRYALATLAALGRPVQGPEAGRTAVCLTGAYTRSLFDRSGGGGFGLSPGDIDEAVQELLAQDLAARDASGRPPSGDLGFERIGQFRTGALGGPSSCGV